MKQHKFGKLLVVALACALACVTTVGLTACGGESDEDQIKDYLNDYFGTLQNLDGDMIDEIESELSSDATFGTYISDGSIDVEEYMDHLFGRLEYKIDDIEVDGDTATAKVTISNPDISAAMTAAQEDLYAMDQDELAQIYTDEGESGLVKQLMTFFYEEEEKQDVQEMGTVTIDMKKDSEDGWEFADEDQASSDIVGILLGE
jgi:hypothetical protein